MKRIDETQDTFWLGLEQLKQDPEFLKKAENEFISSPLKEGDDESAFDRRDFMKIMGASIALASTGCLRRPAQKIIPYNKKPAEIVEGVSNYYTSSYFDGVSGMATLVKTREGRPLFVTGNEDFPMNYGGVTPRAIASLLSLYDPDRLRTPVRNLQNKERTNRETVGTNWAQLDEKVGAALKEGSVRVLMGHNPSPSTRALLQNFVSAFGGQVVEWSAINFESLREAQKRSYGEEVVPRYRFDLAKYIVSIDCDFLSTYLSPAEFARGFKKNRNPDLGPQSRFVAFESLYTLSGMNADDRFQIKPSQQLTVALGLAAELVLKQKKGGGAYSELLKPFVNAAQDLGLDAAMFAQVATDLWNNRGQSLVITGGLHSESEDAVLVHAAVNLLNSILENDGKTVDHSVAPFNGLTATGSSLAALIKEMNEGKVKTLVISGTLNPVYQSPLSAEFKKALQKVKTVVYTGNAMDETAQFADFVAPEGHSAESWNDYEFQKGLYSIQQPTISPLFDTRSFQDSLIAWMKAGGKGAENVENFYSFLRSRWQNLLSSSGNLKGANFEERWISLLQEGFFLTENRRDSTGGARSFNASALNGVKPKASTGLELVLYAKATIGDGTMANNAWMQETPDPVTKIVWDNYAVVSPHFAEQHKLKQDDVITLKLGDKSVDVPVAVLPGVHKEVVGLAVGYGRTAKTQKVAFEVGQNAYPLVVIKNDRPVYAGQVVEFKKTAKKVRLACTQGHHSMEGRQLVVETTSEVYAKDKKAGIHQHTFKEDIWTPHQFKGHRWAMSIDLNSCIGCSSCVVACQSENNVPVVGKKYVLEGREMHWLRIDRYFKGDEHTPDAVMQPIMCQHCENAPCERVCPVLATVHSDEGLNDMIYNRCVGTRYCSNNCPYKVRRFNWFNYTKQYSQEKDTTHMALNPDVTVRSRGVMEKCTFCVQRIKENKNIARDEERELRDGEIKTACQSVCPTQAITFGDLSLADSQVSKDFTSERAYILLEEQNTKARVRYMSKVRNAKRVMAHHGAGHAEEHAPEHGQEKHSAPQNHEAPKHEEKAHQGAGEHS